MKRLVITALSALTLMGSFGASAAYAQPGQYDNRGNIDNRGDNNRGNQNRWDDRNHNGYTYQGRWHYGPPPSNIQGRQDVQFGFHQWRRGDRLPSYYRTHYQVVDYRHEHLRAPPRGYHYVRDDRGDTLLVAVATGAILSAILSSH